MKIKRLVLLSVVIFLLCSCSRNIDDSQYVQGIKVCNETSDLKSTEIESEILKNIVEGFVLRLKMSSKQYEFKDFPSETIVEVKRFTKGNEVYYYCKYSNKSDLVYFFFYGKDLIPCYVLDVKHSFNEIIEFAGVCSYDSEEYDYFYEIVKKDRGRLA